MKRPKDYTEEERYVMRICEACRLTIMTEEINRFEDDQTELTPLQKEIIYQRYRDKAAELLKHIEWETVYELFDRLYKDNEEYHQYDSMAYA